MLNKNLTFEMSFGLNETNYIKLIAITTMLIDHIGVILFPHQLLLRIIGRISFPLFAFQLGIGYEHTRNFKKYMMRILVFGIVIQLLYIILIYFLKINENPFELNILFTLFFGLLSIYCFKKRKFFFLSAILLIPITLDYFKIHVDYGAYGVLLILTLYTEKNNPLKLITIMTILTALYSYFVLRIQIFSLLSIVFIFYPLSLEFRISNTFFYLFYPLHMAILYLISIFI